MISSRYSRDSVIAGGSQLGTNTKITDIRGALRRGTLQIKSTFLTSGFDRLDSLAGRIYGDAKLWWVLAAASDIGWGLQVPPGTIIQVINLQDLERYL